MPKNNHPEYQYLNLLKEVLENGERVSNRTGVDCIRLLGSVSRYDFEDDFPLLTTKSVWLKGIVHELLWFISGSTNIKYLVDNGVKIWNDDAYRYYTTNWSLHSPLLSKEEYITEIENGNIEDDGFMKYGDMGPIYGKQWRNWNGIDQLVNLIEGLKNNPSSRRHILSAWNVDELDQMSLPPCHLMSQYTISNGKLWCHMFQRSADLFLGIPYNIASYSILTYMIAQCIGIEPGGFIHTIHDAHIYVPHIPAVEEQLKRAPRKFPKLVLNPKINNIDDFKYEDIKIEGYNPHSKIKADLFT